MQGGGGGGGGVGGGGGGGGGVTWVRVKKIQKNHQKKRGTFVERAHTTEEQWVYMFGG